MIDHTLVRRYIGAVYELAAEASQTDQLRDELVRLQTAATSEGRLRAILRHPEISKDEKRDLLLRVSGEAPSAIVTGLVTILLEKERTEVLLAAADTFTELVDEARGVVRAHVEVAHEPDADQKTRLEAALSRLVGATVVADWEVAPEVLGGARVRIGGRLVDGSLAGHLSRIAQQAGATAAPHG